jgi:phage/plasmid primase-like uncharacterized protein
MAIDSGILLLAALSLRARYPQSQIIVPDDNDVGLTLRTPALRNVGLEKALESARQVAGKISVTPADRASECKSDVFLKHGPGATAAAIGHSSHCPSTAAWRRACAHGADR